MFDRIDIRKVANGFVVTVDSDGEDKEYIFDTVRKMMSFVKGLAAVKLD